ncbi:MAG: hypothetical protein JSS93_02900 [Bacteroidetes bacterium]|nr:hypothetical protein [Bacteroidota bacterium]
METTPLWTDSRVAANIRLNEIKTEVKLESKINQLQSKIDYCEDRINQIVYQLYELTQAEIKIVEGK